MKWYGSIAFKEEVEEEPGVYVAKVTPHPYYGDILEVSWKEQQGTKINSDLNISNKLSIVADQQLQSNFHKIAYVTFGGAKWTVSDVKVNFPRMQLSLGPIYTEEDEDDDET